MSQERRLLIGRRVPGCAIKADVKPEEKKKRRSRTTFLLLLLLLLLKHVDPPPAGGLKEGAGLAGKLLRLDGLARKENDVLEPKRKRSFPGNSAPLDRLSISAMETKQAAKQSKVVALPRRRVSLPPMDRIGMRRLPSSRG
ncbi:uncharacterized protein V6R79_009445 [Siganus canaliculatus]